MLFACKCEHAEVIDNAVPPTCSANGLGEVKHCSICGEVLVKQAVIEKLPHTEALDALEADNDYLTADGVFPKELIANFIKNKRAECAEMSKIPHPAEFDKYYNL